MELAFQLLFMLGIICTVYTVCGLIFCLVVFFVDDIEKITNWLFKDESD